MLDTKIPLNFQKDSNTQTIQELWQSVAKLAVGRVQDNSLSDNYYLNVRECQTVTLRALLEAIEATHVVARQQIESAQTKV